MGMVTCPECDWLVDAEASLCPECGEDLVACRDEAPREAPEGAARGVVGAGPRSQGAGLPGRVVVGLVCLILFGLAMVFIGLEGLSGVVNNTETNPEWRGDQIGVGIALTVLCLPPGVASLLACVPFFLSARLRWLWWIPIGISLLPIGFSLWLVGQTGDGFGFVLVVITLPLAALPISLSLVGLRGRWRSAS